MRFGVLILVLFLSGAALAQDLAVELDLDGTTGNGPDTVLVDPGDSVQVDVWVVYDNEPGYENWLYFYIYLTDNGLLDLLGADMVIPPPWETAYVTENGDTVLVSAWDPAFPFGADPPLRVFSVHFGALQGSGVALLDVDLERSLWSYWETPERFVRYVGSVVVIGEPTSAKQSSWGAVKGLFRCNRSIVGGFHSIIA